jgi:hypothetical protein
VGKPLSHGAEMDKQPEEASKPEEEEAAFKARMARFELIHDAWAKLALLEHMDEEDNLGSGKHRRSHLPES